MALIYTIKGLIDSDNLQVQDTITLEDNARIYATEWYFESELVRRDVWVSVLRPIDSQSEQEMLG